MRDNRMSADQHRMNYARFNRNGRLTEQSYGWPFLSNATEEETLRRRRGEEVGEDKEPPAICWKPILKLFFFAATHE
jgi:hypothetical protein